MIMGKTGKKEGEEENSVNEFSLCMAGGNDYWWKVCGKHDCW